MRTNKLTIIEEQEDFYSDKFVEDLFNKLRDGYTENFYELDKFNRYLFNSDSLTNFNKRYQLSSIDYLANAVVEVDEDDPFNYLSFIDYFWIQHKLELLPFDHFISENYYSIVECLSGYKVKKLRIEYNEIFERYYLIIYYYPLIDYYNEKVVVMDTIFSNQDKQLVEGFKIILEEWISKNKFKNVCFNIEEYLKNNSSKDIRYIHERLSSFIDKEKYFINKFNYDFKKVFFDNIEYNQKIDNWENELKLLQADKLLIHSECFFLDQRSFLNETSSNIKNVETIKMFDLLMKSFTLGLSDNVSRYKAFNTIIDSFWKINNLELLPIDYHLMLSASNTNMFFMEKFDLKIKYNNFFNRYYLICINHKTKKDLENNMVEIDILFSHHKLDVMKQVEEIVNKWLSKKIYRKILTYSLKQKRELDDVIKKTEKLISSNEYFVTQLGYRLNKSFDENILKEEKN